MYVESIGNYVKIHLANGDSLLSKLTLSHLFDMLPEGEFVRIHRSFVVSQCRIDKFSSTEVTIGSKRLPMGRKYANSVKQ